jgi:predicted dehydrogenase/threonine dehydrogenase-like Zn-dependent dehydrogenase
VKQILQSFKTGATTLDEVPAPIVNENSLLIQTSLSLVSLGTERMLVEFGKASLISKARQQPERIVQVLDKIKSEGLVPTLEAVFSKLEQPLPLGYCNVGKVIAVGKSVSGYTIGDRVASNGQHAEYVCIPEKLAAKIPDNVTDEAATFTVIGSIGLQGIRLLNPTFGESIVVIGLGLIGLISAQLLLSNGCNVIGVDLDSEKCALAEKWGIKTVNPAKGADPVKSVLSITSEIGADGVLITASSKSQDIIAQAARMSRQRGRIILVGVVGLHINRSDFYEKELTFQVSCSYGPGRYDESYETFGRDYPLPYVRWTEKRNFESVLSALGSGQLNVNDLITEIVDLQDYLSIYDNIGRSDSIASILKYNQNQTKIETNIKICDRPFVARKGVIGIIGAGNFTKMTMLPALKKISADIKMIASSGGVTGTSLAKKYLISYSTSDYHKLINDSEIDIVMITTRHNSHAKLIVESLRRGKHVFVEKPVALNHSELETIVELFQTNSKNADVSLMVGYNRRFSPHIQAIKQSIGAKPDAININATMNAGFIPNNIWVHDLKIGGGRIIGEACHYIDLCVFLTGSFVKSVCMNAMGKSPAENTDNASIMLKFENGSHAVINYFSNGAKSYSKERVEVFSQERVFVVDNFRKTQGFGIEAFNSVKTKIDKGHKAQFQKYITRIKEGGSPLIPFTEILNVAEASFAAIKSLKEKRWVDVKN